MQSEPIAAPAHYLVTPQKNELRPKAGQVGACEVEMKGGPGAGSKFRRLGSRIIIIKNNNNNNDQLRTGSGDVTIRHSRDYSR